MKKYFYILFCSVVFILSCAELNKINYFQASSNNYERKTKNFYAAFMDDDAVLSYTYRDKTTNTIISPKVYTAGFLWGPLVIPFIPWITIYSGQHENFEIESQQNHNITPDNMVCIIDGKEVYPYYIESKLISNKTQQYWGKWNYWKADTAGSGYLLYQPPKNWNNFKSPKDDLEKYITYSDNVDSSYSDNIREILKKGYYDYICILNDTATQVIYTYHYRIKQVGIKKVEIRFKDNSSPPLFLKRKKRLRYTFYLFPIIN